ncbi:MAG: response regulator [Pseudobutyrivibrio sp.]|nr:response regulator [Pseudobutyrivibrio sp.]
MQDKVLVIGEKESFLIRVLLGKVKSSDIDCEFVTCKVNDISEHWEKTALVTLYMDDGYLPDDEVLHFLTDKLNEEGVPIIIIGEKTDVEVISDKIPNGLIYKSMIRPINNEDFLAAVKEHIKKLEMGELKKSILIVDDDSSYLGIVREWLKDTYKVFMANSGLQAIKWLGKNKADLILLDYEMPVTTGPQVLEMLRSEKETKNIPVMFLTGKDDKESVMAVLELKPEGYFLKSIERKELIEKLENYFMMHR